MFALEEKCSRIQNKKYFGHRINTGSPWSSYIDMSLRIIIWLSLTFFFFFFLLTREILIMTFSVAVAISVGGVVWISELELCSHNDIFTLFFFSKIACWEVQQLYELLTSYLYFTAIIEKLDSLAFLDIKIIFIPGKFLKTIQKTYI